MQSTADTVMVPDFVNLTALPTKFVNTWEIVKGKPQSTESEVTADMVANGPAVVLSRHQ